MMGRQARGQEQLFYQFSLDDVVPADHLVRRIDAVLDTSWVHRELRPYYSTLGRPSVDPELMIRMLIVGYVFAIRSEREICRDVQVNLAYRWFCGLGLEDRVPNHSVFSRARSDRFRDSDLLRTLFEQVVMSCIEAGLVGGRNFAVDASLIEADANKQRSVPGSDWNRQRNLDTASRAVKEYVDTLDDAAFGGASEVVPKFVSPSDPASQWTGAHKGPAFFAYADNYLIDTKHAVIVDVEASRAIRPAEVGAARTMIERTEERFGIKPGQLAGDTAYGAAPMLAWLVKEKGIEPHIPVFDKSARKDGTLSRAAFTFDADQNIYICPQGKPLTTTGRVHQGRTLYYRASKFDCDACPLKPKCCPKAPVRRIPRDIDEDARDLARSLAGTPAFEQSRRDRKKVEMAFAHLKRIFGLGRLRLRGPRGAQDEFLLAATAQNLMKLARKIARPPPLALACAQHQDQPTKQMDETANAVAVKLPREGRFAASANLDVAIASMCQITSRRQSDFCNTIGTFRTLAGGSVTSALPPEH
jgi:transposase